MRAFLAVLAAWLFSASLASAQMMGITGGPFTVGSAYSGPGDVISGAASWYGLRAYNAAYATGSNNAVNYRRASDNSTQNGVILANGSFDIATANTFAGADATASCTSLTNTLTCTGASSTPHIGSTVSGVGLTQPCFATAIGTFTGGAGTVTTGGAGCGTVSVAASATFQYGLFVAEWYDQTGHGLHGLQATAADQPELLPVCQNGKPCLYFNGSNWLLATVASPGQPLTYSDVMDRLGGLAGQQNVQSHFPGGTDTDAGWHNSTSEFLFAGSTATVTSTSNVFHVTQFVINGASSLINLDGVNTTGLSSGAQPGGTTYDIGSLNGASDFFTGYMTEAGYWLSAFSTTQANNMCHNQFTYWQTGTSC